LDLLGINALHGDSAAAVLRDGAFAAGIEEERLNRVKHWAGFPAEAIRTVLREVGTDLSAIEHVAVSRDPSAHLLNKVLFTLRRRPGLDAIRSRLTNHQRIKDLGSRLAEMGSGKQAFRGAIHNVEHHRAHLASAFFCSPFEEAACLTVDGFGDFLSSMSAAGKGGRLEVLDEVMFPHSLGILYTAMTQFLGFPSYGDEYKVMGLAAFGQPSFLPRLREVVSLTRDGRFELDVDYFVHASEGATMSWNDGEPVIGRLWSQRFVDAFGPAREPCTPITERHHDLAASLQAIYEEAFFHRAGWLQKKTGLKALCLAGGCAMNSVANGKIFSRTDFRDVFVQPAAGDAGTALGAAQHVWHQVLGKPRAFVMEHSCWGPSFPEARIVAALRAKLPGLDPNAAAAGQRVGGLQVRRYASEPALVGDTAAAIAEGEIVGWYQGRSEWGPRALGNRSIVADPRRADIKDVLNARIKRREPFRPFAPSILEERVGEYFSECYPDPFMTKVYPIRAEKRAAIPAVTHVDGSGRLQTVSQRQNPRYWALIRAFEEKTGVPVLLNTSFNENEPIVNTPEEALECFFRTRMDLLVLGDWSIERSGGRER
jgi:carbamoyltransferase